MGGLACVGVGGGIGILLGGCVWRVGNAALLQLGLLGFGRDLLAGRQLGDLRARVFVLWVLILHLPT